MSSNEKGLSASLSFFLTLLLLSSLASGMKITYYDDIKCAGTRLGEEAFGAGKSEIDADGCHNRDMADKGPNLSNLFVSFSNPGDQNQQVWTFEGHHCEAPGLIQRVTEGCTKNDKMFKSWKVIDLCQGKAKDCLKKKP